jgi:hypothetical protein
MHTQTDSVSCELHEVLIVRLYAIRVREVLRLDVYNDIVSDQVNLAAKT